jgi:hypothetical protein
MATSAARARVVIGNLVYLGCMVIVSILLIDFLKKEGIGLLMRNPITAWVGLILVLLGSTVLHECGHLLAGLAGKFRIHLFKVGPLVITKEGRTIRWRFQRLPHLAYACVSAVPTAGPGLRRRMALFAAGGPLMTLLAAVLCLSMGSIFLRLASSAIAQADQDPSPEEFSLWLSRMEWGCWLRIAGLLNLYSLIANLIPSRLAGRPNDGALLLALLTGGRAVERDMLVFGLQADLMSGIRCRDWEPALVAEMLGRRDGSSGDVAANLFGYYHALDRGEVEHAGKLLDLALAGIAEHPPRSRQGFSLEGAFFEAIHRRNPGPARAWFDLAKAVPPKDPVFLRAKAAVLLAEGRPEEAAESAEECLAALTDTPFPGNTAAIRDWINALLAKARHSLAERNSAIKESAGNNETR